MSEHLRRAWAAWASEMPKATLNPSKPTYLRIGTWDPTNERSMNYVTGEREWGVSVYDLHNGQPVVPPDDEWGSESLHERLNSDEPKFLVQGDEAGVGGGGEPVLTNVVVVGTWS